MNIGIDIDGCLNNFQKAMAKILKRDYNLETPADVYYMAECLNLSEDEFRVFWDKYNPELLELMELEIGAFGVMNRLKHSNHKLTIITARNYRVADLTIKWLNKYKIPYDDIYFSADMKEDCCKWQKISVMIEDNSDNAIRLAECGIDVLLYSRRYNEHLNHERIIRCNNWLEIEREIYKR